MSPEVEDLAEVIYPHLKAVASKRRPELTYGDLCARLGGRWAAMEPHHKWLFDALGLISRTCRARGLPALSAVVVTRETQMPGSGYYGEAHPDVQGADARRIAWARELELVRGATYPDSFRLLGQLGVAE